MTRFLVAIYFIETGLLLVVAPWTEWWGRNFFADVLPWLHTVMALAAVRIAVAVMGLITAVAGLRDVRDLLFQWLSARRGVPDVRPPEL